MNAARIAWKEMKQLRDIRTLVFMLAFPIVLMLILGTALSGVFKPGAIIGELDILYRQPEANQAAQASWQAFVKEAEASGIRFTPAAEGEDGIREVADNRYDGYAEWQADGIRFYRNSASGVEGNVLEGMLAAYLGRYNVTAQLAGAGAAAASEGEAGGSGAVVAERTLNAPRQPGSIDYYAIVMTTMIAMYGALSASYLIDGERKRHTAVRLAAAPISKTDIFVGKLAGSLLVNALSMGAVMLISGFAFGANWGGADAGLVFLVLMAEAIFATGLGLGMSYLMSGEAARAIIMVVVQLSSFFGGAYFPVEGSTGWLHTIASLTPLQWANHGIIELLYADSPAGAYSAIGKFGAVAALFLVIAVAGMRRREGL